jgi:hypothetical protein
VALLRESGKSSSTEYELTAVMRGLADSGVPHGALLTRFVDAVLGNDANALSLVRFDVRQVLGDAAFVDACATVASFNAVVKIADGTGIPLEDWKEARTEDIRASLGIDALRS